MTRAERWLLDLANAVVGGSGAVYFVMKYLMRPSDEWSVVNHPWQPHVQHLHVVAAPLLIIAVALLWKSHVIEKMGNGSSRGRVSGSLLAIQFIPMVFSGYLIQVSVGEGWRTAWIWVHLATGGLWLVAVLAHRFKKTNGSEE
jgi:hypothetical protein